MTIPRFSTPLWEGARRGLSVRRYDVKPGKTSPCWGQLWFQPPFYQAGWLLAPSRQAIPQQQTSASFLCPSTVHSRSKAQAGPPPCTCLRASWCHQDAEPSFFSARESMWYLPWKSLQLSNQKPQGRSNGKCLDIFLAPQSCNVAVIICLVCRFLLVSAQPKPSLGLGV